jgi:hypothetical protein
MPRITMTGADTAHYRDATAVTARLIRFPDGLQRIIRLTYWQWQVFNDWPQVTGWHPDRLPEQALQMARIVRDENGSDTFEADIRYALAALINLSKPACTAVPVQAVNENG